MQLCQNPITLRDHLRPPTWMPLLSKWIRPQFACGRCKGCSANRKQDWSGKLLAEAHNSASVAFLTLTYAVEQKEFHYRHVQLMLKSVRKHFWAKNKTTVRFFCCGERGDKFGRRHWHLLLFFNKPTRLAWTKEGEKWQFWPHGWTNVQNLEGATRQKKIRYVVGYLGKDEHRPRGSLRPALGSAYFKRLAFETAVNGLCPDGTYTFPEAVFTRGPRSGQRQNFHMKGANARSFCSMWAKVFQRKFPDKPLPYNEFVNRYCDAAVFRAYQKRVPVMWQSAVGRLKRSDVKLGERPFDGEARWFVGFANGQPWAHCILVDADRRGCTLVLEDQLSFIRFGWDVGEVLELPEINRCRINGWIHSVRSTMTASERFEMSKRDPVPRTKVASDGKTKEVENPHWREVGLARRSDRSRFARS